MKCNLGKNDRLFRVILGIVVIGLGLEFKSWWGIIGLIPLLTAIIGFCPAYLPFGVSTCDSKSEAKKDVKKEVKKQTKK